MARDTQPPERTLDSLVGHSLEVFAPALHLLSQVGRNVQGLAHVIKQRLTALVNDFSPCVDQARGTVLFLRENDLRKDHLGQVMPVVAIDHLDLVSFPYKLGEAIERYVRARRA